MGKNNKQIKKLLFRCGTEALSSATGVVIENYYCPICGKPFSEQDLDIKTLTLEHIPPEAQGGKGIALTCVDCNTTAGRTVDVAVSTRNHLEGVKALYAQNGSFNTRVRVNFGNENLAAVNYELFVKDGAVRFYPVEKANHPDYATNMRELIKETNSTANEERKSWQMTTRKRYNPWHAKVGDLRSAFLVCFAMFGYNFAFDSALDPVRQQIKEYDEKIIDHFFISLDTEISSNFSLGIVKSPFSAIFCQLQNYGIFLPWVGSPKEFYKFLEKDSQENGRIDFEWTPIPWPKRFEAKLDISK